MMNWNKLIIHMVVLIALATYSSCTGTASRTLLSTNTPGSGGPVISTNNTNPQGINIAAPLDYEADHPYADVIHTSRDAYKPGTNQPVTMENGWPAEDVKFGLWDAIGMNGTYAISFTGQADVTGSSDIKISEITYDPEHNTTTALGIVTSSDKSNGQLIFQKTRRTKDSPINSGITNLKVMRPITAGSTTAHDVTELFHRSMIQLIQNFNVVRYMDFLAINKNQQVNWSDRALPSQLTYNVQREGYGWEGLGGPWEHVVLLSNQAQRDAWINIPAKVTDDYVTKVAQLFAFGSDGKDPYTGPYGSAYNAQTNPRPAPNDPKSWTPGTTSWYPPLAANLNLYVEYGNELWNGGGEAFYDAFKYNRDQGSVEVKRPGSPLNYDGNGESNLGSRQTTYRSVQISKIFRKVFGDDQMIYTGNSRIRPILAMQFNNGQGALFQGVKMLQGYYSNGEGSFVTDPRPPRYYFYGAGGAIYMDPDDNISLTIDNIWSSSDFNVDNWSSKLNADTNLTAAVGLKLVAYEGGPQMMLDKGKNISVKQAAWSDPRMRTNVVDHYRAWSSYGGDLVCWYNAAGDVTWSFAGPTLFDTNTPKMHAVQDISSASKYPVTYGTAIPAKLEGAQFSVSSRGWDAPGKGSKEISSGDAKTLQWLAYIVRASSSGNVSLTVTVSGAKGGAQLAFYDDGLLLNTLPVPTGDGVTLSPGSFPVTSGLHGIIVRAVSGSVKLDQITVN